MWNIRRNICAETRSRVNLKYLKLFYNFLSYCRSISVTDQLLCLTYKRITATYNRYNACRYWHCNLHNVHNKISSVTAAILLRAPQLLGAPQQPLGAPQQLLEAPQQLLKAPPKLMEAPQQPLGSPQQPLGGMMCVDIGIVIYIMYIIQFPV